MKRYRLFGFTLASELELTHHVPEAPEDATADLRLALVEKGEAVRGNGDGRSEVLYRSPERLPDGRSVLEVERIGQTPVLTYSGEGSFAVSSVHVAATPAPSTEGSRSEILRLLEVRLLGPVVAFWLERCGLPTLHAAAVTVGGRAVAFLGTNRGGKSSLAAALMTAGHRLLTDDLLAVESAPEGFRARPSYPQMRLWPADAERFVNGAARLPRAHPGFEKRRVPVGPGGFGRFDDQDRPLARIYLPERRPGARLSITAIEKRAAVMALVRHSFLPRLSEAMGWGPRRLELFARLLGAVPVHRLTYPDGWEHLPRVRDAILDDLRA